MFTRDTNITLVSGILNYNSTTLCHYHFNSTRVEAAPKTEQTHGKACGKILKHDLIPAITAYYIRRTLILHNLCPGSKNYRNDSLMASYNGETMRQWFTPAGFSPGEPPALYTQISPSHTHAKVSPNVNAWSVLK